jgi:hypothetical protein
MIDQSTPGRTAGLTNRVVCTRGGLLALDNRPEFLPSAVVLVGCR